MTICKQILFPLFCLLVLGCTKWDLDRVEFAEVITIGVIDVGSNSAFLLGDIENLRGSTLSEVGFLLSPVYFEDFEFRINNQDLTRFLTPNHLTYQRIEPLQPRRQDLIQVRSISFVPMVY